ncbi:MAG: hypothetical protein WC539_04215 [Nitrospirota bacterium]
MPLRLNLLKEPHCSRPLLKRSAGYPFVLKLFDDLISLFQAVLLQDSSLIRDGHFLHVGRAS